MASPLVLECVLVAISPSGWNISGMRGLPFLQNHYNFISLEIVLGLEFVFLLLIVLVLTFGAIAQFILTF